MTLSVEYLPALVFLFIKVTGTASMDVEVANETGVLIPVHTQTVTSVIRLSVTSPIVAINVTAVSGTVRVTARPIAVENLPDELLTVFTSGGGPEDITFKKVIATGPDAQGASQTGKPLQIAGRDSGGAVRTIRTHTDGKLMALEVPGNTSVLAQSAPGAVLTDLYTVGASKVALVTSIVIANRTAVAKTYRLSLAVGGAVDAVQQYLAFDYALGVNDTHIYNLGIWLQATDVVRVYGSTTDVSFNVLGIEWPS